MYADDTRIIVPSCFALYKLLDLCSEFAVTKTIVFYSSKSKYVCFKPQSLMSLYVPDMLLNGNILKCVTDTTYLGISINCQIHNDADIMHHVKATYTKGNIMISRFKQTMS